MDIEKHIAGCEQALDEILLNVDGIIQTCKVLAERLKAEREIMEAKGEIEPVKQK